MNLLCKERLFRSTAHMSYPLLMSCQRILKPCVAFCNTQVFYEEELFETLLSAQLEDHNCPQLPMQYICSFLPHLNAIFPFYLCATLGPCHVVITRDPLNIQYIAVKT
jgi:hypothetical protein